jgi:glycosyltransferase involved in cell wall biosynthesis
MRVLVVVPWEPWRVGDGVVLPLFNHLRTWTQRHDVVVLSGSGPGSREHRVTGPEQGLPAGLTVRMFGTSRPRALDFASRRIRSELQREPAHVLYVERPALLQAFDEEAPQADVVYLVGWGTAQLAARTTTPAVHFAVDPWGAAWKNRRLSAGRRLVDLGQRSLVLRHEGRHYPRCSCVVVVTDADAEDLRRQVPAARFEVVPNGVEAGPEPRPGPRPPVLVFHGSFENQANVDAADALVREILPLVLREVPEATVLLVGRYPSATTRALAGPRVVLRADVPSVRAELDEAAVHVDWMTSGLGLKNKVLEAMAAGLPVVTNALGARGIGAGGGVSVASDTAQAAQRITELLRDEDLRAREGNAARGRAVAEFGWEQSAARMEALWERSAAGT